LSPKEIVGRCIQIEGGEGFDETDIGCIEGIVIKWMSGGVWYSREAAVHSVLTRGMKKIEVKLLCRPNINVPEARKFVELHGVPSFIIEAERLEAQADRMAWGTRLNGMPQLEVTIFAAQLDSTESKIQVIARTLCIESKAYAKKLAPALYERRAEFFGSGDEAKGQTLARDWARACSRSEPFFKKEILSVSAGVEWVRQQIIENKYSPDRAAPKNKQKIIASSGRAYSFLTNDSAGLPIKPNRMLFRSRACGGTRLKIELKSVGSSRANIGSLDLDIDSLLRKNAEYPAGWIPLTKGNGKLQIRLFNLDPDSLPLDDTMTNPAKILDTKKNQTQEISAHQQQEDTTLTDAPPAKVYNKNNPPPPPPPRARENIIAEKKPPNQPSLSVDLAAQLTAGETRLKPASRRVLPPPPDDGGKFIFDELASNLAKLRMDIVSGGEDSDDDDDDDDFFDD